MQGNLINQSIGQSENWRIGQLIYLVNIRI